jgi:hypothetical protein
MKIENELGIRIAYLDNNKEYLYLKENTEIKTCDLIKINQIKAKIPKELTNEFFFVPNKIQYYLKLPNSFEKYIAKLSLNRKKKIKKALSHNEIEISFEQPIQENDFKIWIDIYKKKILDKEKGVLRITDDWLTKKKEKNISTGAIFAKINNEIIGGIIFKIYKKNKLSIGYSAVKKEIQNLGVNDLLNCKLIEYAIKKKFKIITRGMDSNFYGNHLSPGIYLFKKSLGFKIKPLPKKGFCLLKINNMAHLEDNVFFISIENKKKIANLITKKPNEINLDEYNNKKDYAKINLFVFEKNNKNNLKLINEIIN